jgi:tetraacyldisaccharide 4'-kinase
MNGWCLPAGPLREPVSRLARGCAGSQRNRRVAGADFLGRHFRCALQGTVFHRLDDPRIKCGAADLAGLNLHAVAGIGAPQRFFDHLRGMGMDILRSTLLPITMISAQRICSFPAEQS